ncbi:Brp/Blh family beta-carotene 15,15'-dioxygenase [Cecembia lonarensis]|uniref:Probable beta-carotene 15,15'-dioxygenase n=1 Tax=Cecembia lonarensis (strain CCUG 58316 / KCTC 22772 / LW9) TaxID=1225176 RepID=K1L267_CECL9|nr:Brp/Blh family beta-carotene 15,15'-dioxygenase [Cecembia lonarensis]EKB48861.1 beta-carotene 15,15'-monooxygenase, Brp/Blh family [Cecembia lonarensis LW9]
MRNIEKIGKTIGLMIAIVYLLFFQGNQIFEWVLFASILLTIGIPHGALDHLLLNPKISNKGLVKFILKYLAIIVVYLVVWIFLPVPALLAFLLMSAYHFGQSHFIGNDLQSKKKTTYLITGVFYLSVIFWGDFDNTAIILKGIVDISPLSGFGWPIIIGSFILSMILLVKNSYADWRIFSLEMVIIGFLLYQLPLLVGFIIYFGFWHALPSMTEEYQSLKWFLGRNKLKNFIKRLMPFTAASVGGMWLILAIFYPGSEPEELVLLFFILVSLISAPHIWYMNLFLETKKN